MTKGIVDQVRSAPIEQPASATIVTRAELPPRTRSFASALFVMAQRVATLVVPKSALARIGSVLVGDTYTPRAGRVRFGDLRRVSPIGKRGGRDRGALPIDRFYVERFLGANTRDVQGRVLEVGESHYTRKYGGAMVERSEVLDVKTDAFGATIIDELAGGDQIPSDAFDCVILTQVLHVVADPLTAMRTAHRILKPGGVLLMTLPGLSQISRWDAERWGDYWRFTPLSARHLASSVFSPASILVEAHGNVLAAISFLHGLAAQELDAEELEYQDADYPLLITVRATKQEGGR
jgi:SAM-dependent methyltransferase